MTRPARSLETLAELEGAVADLLSTLEPCLDYVTAPQRQQHELREAFSRAAAKLADFENGTDV